jgi:hypothetical protein
MDHLPGPLRTLAEAQDGVFTRAQALSVGLSSRQVEEYLRRRVWSRVRHGVYAGTDAWALLDEHGRHRAAVRGVRLRCGDDLVVSHLSAAVMYGWPLWGIALGNVWVTRGCAQRSRAEAGVHHLVASLPSDEVCSVDGVPVTAPERTLVDFARVSSFESAVVTCDAALRSGADRETVHKIFDRQAQWPGARTAATALHFADRLSESVGESRTRVLCYQQGLPTPRLQADLVGWGNRYLGRGDFLFEDQHTLLEFDGEMKYGRDFLPVVDPSGRHDPGERVFQEKRREDAIREELGLEVVRMVWSDLADPRRTAARIRAAFARAATRRPRVA